jgi:hypothetical protein
MYAINSRWIAMYLSEFAPFVFSGFESTIPQGQIADIGVLITALDLVCAKPNSGAHITGLTGAAWAVANADSVEQGGIMILAMRRLGTPAASLIGHLWRPVLAAAIMALTLIQTGYGLSDRTDMATLAIGCGLGAVTYLTVLLAAWLAAACPAGAESDLFALLSRRFGR